MLDIVSLRTAVLYSWFHAKMNKMWRTHDILPNNYQLQLITAVLNVNHFKDNQQRIQMTVKNQ
jgi:hypothetical protein